MRCYFIHDGHIESVVVMEGVGDDNAAIRKGLELFLGRLEKSVDGFEIWERDRLVYRYPEADSQSDPTSNNGMPSSKSPQRKGGKKSLPRVEALI